MDHKYDSVKVLLLVVIVGFLGVMVFKNPNSFDQRGKVYQVSKTGSVALCTAGWQVKPDPNGPWVSPDPKATYGAGTACQYTFANCNVASGSYDSHGLCQLSPVTGSGSNQNTK